MFSMQFSEQIEAALKSFDDLLAKKPHVDHAMLAEAVQKIVPLRDELIELRRQEKTGREDEQCLANINSVLSLAYSAEFPLIGMKWDRIEMVSKALRQLLKTEGQDASIGL